MTVKEMLVFMLLLPILKASEVYLKLVSVIASIWKDQHEDGLCGFRSLFFMDTEMKSTTGLGHLSFLTCINCPL